MTLFLDQRGAIALELAVLMEQSVPLQIADLNPNLPDTFWVGADGTNYGTEIKQPGEVLGNISDTEEQLSRQYGQVDQLTLCIAGIVLPAEHGCFTLRWAADGKSGYSVGIRGGSPYHQSYDGYVSWLRSLESWGIRVVELPNKLALARYLVAAYLHDQKPEAEHRTFKRLLRTKKPLGTWNPYALSLMGLTDPETGRTFCGPERAQALLDVYSTPAAVFAADNKELAKVAGVGKVTAEKIKRAVGQNS